MGDQETISPYNINTIHSKVNICSSFFSFCLLTDTYQIVTDPYKKKVFQSLRGSPLYQLYHYANGKCFREASLLNPNYLCFLKAKKTCIPLIYFHKENCVGIRTLENAFFSKGRQSRTKKRKIMHSSLVINSKHN